MAEVFQSSRKRSFPLYGVHGEHVFSCHFNQDHTGEASVLSWKRPRPEQDLTYAPQHEDAFVGAPTYGFTDGMSQDASGLNFFGDPLSTFSSSHCVTSPDPLTAEGLYLPPQIVGRSRSTTDPSVTCAGTSETLSPGVDDRQHPHDAYDFASITLGGLSEKSFTGLEDPIVDPHHALSSHGHHGNVQSSGNPASSTGDGRHG